MENIQKLFIGLLINNAIFWTCSYLQLYPFASWIDLTFVFIALFMCLSQSF